MRAQSNRSRAQPAWHPSNRRPRLLDPKLSEEEWEKFTQLLNQLISEGMLQLVPHDYPSNRRPE